MAQCTIPAPHLAYFDPIEFDDLQELLKNKNAHHTRKSVNGVDPRLRVPRKRTVFPAQHALCWYCGSQFIRGGNGMTDNLMCSNSRERHCWNSMAFNGRIAAMKLVEAITRELYALPGFDAQFAEMVRFANECRSGSEVARRIKLQDDEADLARRIVNFKKAIGKRCDQTDATAKSRT